ncbi:MAG: hypothetical protein JXR88_04965 [Clostridia bacterium]|nr:hypothetical protein [Clostridia bacterium]
MILYLIDFLILIPLALFIHQMGHGLGVKLFGGAISEISIGQGQVFLTLKKLKLKTFIFMGGSFSYLSIPNYKPIKKIIILLCGSGLNILSIVIALIVMKILPKDQWLILLLNHFVDLSWLVGIIALLPLALGSTKLDGLQIKELIQFHQAHVKSEKKAS